LPDGDNDRNLIDERPAVAALTPRRGLVALLVAAMLAIIVIAALTLY